MENSQKGPNEHLEASKVFDVSHVTAVLTGGGSGIGLMMTQALVANGAKVHVCDIRPEALETVVRLYDKGPGQIIAHTVDVGDKASVQRLAAAVAALEPRGIQLLVNNAGVALDPHTEFAGNGMPDVGDAAALSAHFLRSDPGDWARMFAVNVAGAFFMSVAFLPLLERGGRGARRSSSVVNVASNSGFLKGSTRGYIGYSASKAATAHLSRMLATTFAHTGVRVNTIAPGTFPTEMTTGSSGPDQKSTLRRPVSNTAGRPGTETDMAATILLLAGPGGAYYNHQILFVDGGETLIEPAAI